MIKNMNDRLIYKKSSTIYRLIDTLIITIYFVFFFGKPAAGPRVGVAAGQRSTRGSGHAGAGGGACPLRRAGPGELAVAGERGC